MLNNGSKRVAREIMLALLSALLLSGCGSTVNEADLVKEVFLDHGFFFVWEAHLGQERSPDLLKPPHALDKQRPPDELQIDRAYVFHPAGPQDYEQLGEHSLPTWLRTAGCSVISAPSQASDNFIYPHIGGPEFVIRFRCGTDEYRIEARVDPYLISRPNQSTALVLVREK